MKKHRPPLQEEEKNELKRLSSIDLSEYSESDIREEFLVELCKILGYRKENDYSISREESFKLNPLFLSVGSKRIKLDYLCSLRKKYFWIMDAKEGKCPNKSTPPCIGKSEVGQAHFYALHPEINCRYFVVSNGWYTNLYDRDILDDNCTPLLSIPQKEIATEFLELDQYIGSTQILPMLKERLLDQIEKVFQAEFLIERHDEFIQQVAERAARSKEIVEKGNQMMIAGQPHNSQLMAALKSGDLSGLVYTIFPQLRSLLQMTAVSNILINRIKDNHRAISSEFNEFVFFRRLMLDIPYPVHPSYYPAVLHFLLQLRKQGVNSVLYTEQKTDALILKWIDTCIYHLSDHPELRYLWATERLFAKITKQTIILMPYLRREVENILTSELFYLPDEKFTPIGPDQASTTINTIETALNIYRSRFFRKYFDSPNFRFKKALADQEYQNLQHASQQLDQLTGNNYKEIKKDLGGSWEDLQWYDELQFDKMGSAACNVLFNNIEHLPELNGAQTKRIIQLAEWGFTNYADKLCISLGLHFNPPVKPPNPVTFNAFFDPSIDQYSLE